MAAVATRLAPLGDDHVCPDGDGLADLLQVGDPDDQHRPCLMDQVGIGGRVPEVEHDGWRPMAQALFDRLRSGRPGDKADPPWLGRPFDQQGDLRLESFGITASAADQPEAPGVRHSRRQFASRRSGHRSQNHRVLDREQFREGGLQGHAANRSKWRYSG